MVSSWAVSRVFRRGPLTWAEIVSLTFYERHSHAVIEFADGGTDETVCTLWQASEWAGSAGLTIVVAAQDRFHWELVDRPIEVPKA